ncbi:hypothetical protein FA13DRAFT_1789900 [Coprinellus micaceus]|uniref:Uncharacterized protein n=1 Tax=Coprinellus micaceus TaxID=71717 RepID=A0A4Y7TH03_COPMI|nr:hypothetical protein FA13DRAFT_1789900 [Coprinellus micaceus]
MRGLWAQMELLVEEGDVKPLRVEVLPDGLKGIPEGLKRLEEDKVSGVKLVAHPQDTFASISECVNLNAIASPSES